MSLTDKTIVYLCSPSKKKICVLNGIDDSSGGITCNGTDFNTLTFDVNKYITNDGELIESNGYSYIKSKMYLLLQNAEKGNGYYRLTTEPTKSDDGNGEKLTVSATSAESELVDKNLVGVKINTGDPDSYENLDESNIGVDKLPKEYVTFCNKTNPKLSLLHIVTEKAIGWTIGEVDTALTTTTTNPTRNPKYTFTIDNEDIYSFLINTLSKAAKCVFVFDIENFKINAYAIENMGKNTGVVVSLRNIANSIKMSCSDNSIYTCFRVAGGDGIDGIAEVNFGQDYIEDLSYYAQYPFMEEALITKYNAWVNYREERRADYITTMKAFTEANSKANEILNRVPDDGLAKTQWNGYSAEALQDQLAFYNALKGIVEKDQAYQTNGVFDIEKLKLVPLYYTYECYQPIIDTIKVAFENRLKLSIDTELNTFLTTFTTEIEKIIAEFTVGGIVDMVALNASDKKYAYDSLEYCIPIVQYYIDNYTTIDRTNADYPSDWEANWELFGVSELTTKLQLYDKTLGILKQTLDVTYLTNEYTYLTLPDTEKAKYTNEADYITKKAEYQTKLNLYNNCSTALAERKTEYDLYVSYADYFSNGLKILTEEVDITNSIYGFTTEELAVLDRLRNYTDYTNENVISTKLDTLVDDIDSKIFLYNDAKEQLYIKAHPQFTWETDVDNLFALDEFKAWNSDFSLWNFINLAVSDTYMEKLRIMSLEFNPFDKFSNNLTVTFSNSIRTNQGVSDFITIFEGIASANKNSITSGSSSNSSSSDSSMINSLIQLLNYNSTVKSAINDVANKVTTESQIETSKELTKTNAITNKTYNTVLDWAYEDTLDGTVEIRGGAIKSKSIVSDKLATNAIMSLNYPPETTGYFSASGTFFDLENGSITSKNFSIDGDGNARFNGIIETKVGGHIGGWNIDEKDLYNSSSGMSSNTFEHYAFWAGETNNKKGATGTDAKCRIGHAGDFYSISGSIGGWNITESTLYKATYNSGYVYRSELADYGITLKLLNNNNLVRMTELTHSSFNMTGVVNTFKCDGDVLLLKTTNVQGSLSDYRNYIGVGWEGSQLLKLFNNTIQSVSGTSTAGALHINPMGGTVQLGAVSGSELIVNGKTQIKGNGLELYYDIPYIDFHFNNSVGDYTSRIIEDESSKLTIDALEFRPQGDGNTYLGSTVRRWNTVYAVTGTIQTSDRNKKMDISDFTEQQEQFFMLLSGKSYKFIDGTSGRTHYGFISQDVEQAMFNAGLIDLDFAGFCKDTITDEESGDETVLYALRYDEFIALNTHMTQKALNEISTLKKEIAEIKSMLI